MGETGRILIVCRANVCRSALAEIAITNSIPATMPIDVSSAGVAAAGDSVCPLVADWDARPSWHDHASRHHPRQVNEELVEGADLVLTASVSIRGDVTRLVPTARRKVFTLNEAAQLGVGFSRSEREGNAIHTYAEYLDRQRLHSPTSEPVPHRRGRRPPADPLSIPDNHGRRIRLHRDTLKQVATTSWTITRQLVGDRRNETDPKP